MFSDILARAVVKTGDTVFDVGAHNGALALKFAKLVGPDGLVVAFEPHPGHFASLQSRAHPAIKPFHLAVSDKKGSVTLFAGRAPRAAEASTIVADLASHDRFGPTIEQYEVHTIRLDDVAAEFPDPVFVKIDVEAAEGLVIKGAQRMIQRARPVLFIEYSPLAGQYAPEHIAWIQSQGYTVAFTDIMLWDGRDVAHNAEDPLWSFEPAIAEKHAPVVANVVAWPAAQDWIVRPLADFVPSFPTAPSAYQRAVTYADDHWPSTMRLMRALRSRLVG